MKSRYNSLFLIGFLLISRRFLLFLLTVGLTHSNVFAETLLSNVTSENKEFSNYNKKGVENSFTLRMFRDPCNRQKPYNATLQYKEGLRVYVGPISKDGYILSIPFKGETYLIDIKKVTEDVLKLWRDEVAIKYQDILSYKFVPSYQEANMIILVMAWPEAMRDQGILGFSVPKGVPNGYLKKLGKDPNSALILLPDATTLIQIMKPYEKAYDRDIKNGNIIKKTTPGVYVRGLINYAMSHEFGHAMGFKHPRYKDYPQYNETLGNDTIEIKNNQRYDNQPPIMVNFMNYPTFYSRWRQGPLSLLTSIIPSAQEKDAFDAAQDRLNSGIKNNRFYAPQCNNLQITFDSD